MPSLTPELAAEEEIRVAERAGEESFVTAVAGVLDRAAKLRWLPWRRRAAIGLYVVVADLDIGDDRIDELVNEARRWLEQRGIPCEPSFAEQERAFFDAKPARERHLLEARRTVVAAPGLKGCKQVAALRSALRHFQLAARCSPLGSRDQKIVAGLEARLGIRDGR